MWSKYKFYFIGLALLGVAVVAWIAYKKKKEGQPTAGASDAATSIPGNNAMSGNEEFAVQKSMAFIGAN
jgi:threonine/homoserine/homoserine lactone efflux protein